MRSFLLGLFLVLLAGALCAQVTKPKDVLATFTLNETFGVAHPDQVVDFDLDAPVDPAKSYLVGPNGAESPYQLLDGGKKLALRIPLPASRLAIHRNLSYTCERWARDYKFETKGVEQCCSTDGTYFTTGDVVQVDGTTLPAGLLRNTNYYVTRCEFREVQGWGFYFIGLSETPGGPQIAITKDGANAFMVAQSLVADLDADTLYCHAHGLLNGYPVIFRTSGELPQPLKPDTTYYVCNATADRVQVSATQGGKPIDLLTPGTGVHELLVGWTWTLKSGRAPGKYTRGVQVAEKAEGLWEITNDRLGIRLPVSHTLADPLKAPSPVQGVRLADGTWAAAGPNPIAFTPGTRVTKVEVKFLEQGPLKVVAELTYTLECAQFNYGATVVRAAGPGTYVCRIEVQAGQPSVLFEEDTDCTFSYNIPLQGLTLTQARYRGHSVSNPQYGYRPDGRKVTENSTDTFMDLPFDKNYASSYVSNFNDGCIRWMHPWDPWLFDSGHYWMLYNKDGADESPLIGYYDGRASRLRNAGAVGVGVYTRTDKSAGITVQAWQRGPDASVHPKPRWQWRLFVGRKGPDMRDWRLVQPIEQQMNLHGGIGLNKIHRLTFEFDEPKSGYGAMYMPKDAVQMMIKKVREDQQFYSFAYNAVSYYRDLIDMWRDDSGARVHQMANALWLGTHDGLNELVNGQGIYGFGYWHAGLEGSRALMRLDQVLASDKATDADKALAKQTAVFYGAVLWDDDHAPLSVPAGVNLGTANMPIQQQNYRDMYTLYLAKNPMMAARAAEVQARLVDNSRAMLHGTVSESGAHMGCSHYIGAAMGPLLSTMQQLKQYGIADFFKDEPRMKQYAEFEMNFSSPPDPRFSRRVRPSIGDACPGENTEFLGQLGTSYADIDPDLSKRLMGMWRAVGKPESDFHGATILKIDERLPGETPKLGCRHVEGWYSALRFGWDTPNETTAWFVNGNWYRDHASNDLGEPIIYALCAPLSLDFGTMYSPPSPGGFVHSVVLPEAQVGEWKQNPPDINKGGRWGSAKTLDYQANEREAWSTASFQMGQDTWTRTLKVAMLQDDLAVIGIKDAFTATDNKIFLLNLMNDGAVQTPDGAKNVGDSFAIPAGITKLHYTGQRFAKHPAGGIDWDLYIITDTPQEAFIAQYAHKNVMPETQSILRLKGTGHFQVVIVAYNKGAQPAVTVTPRNGGAVVTAGANKTTF